jgi:eukaryotic-like serine/threonine-protein kinase
MIGTRLAHYEITSHLGSGGMGDVYQAIDTRLGRSVAIKLLPEAFTVDAERVARFEREARVLASLSHPNIAGIYGLEQSNGKNFLIMELVTGETLAERMARGAIPLEETVRLTTHIAEALEAAHDKGIVHRDLKPANIKITIDGQVKVLDFGLAKAYEQDASSPALSNSPTMLSAAMTEGGMILGTAGYMSPEQAAGKPADKRADIWSFGVVLWEMITGSRLFADGESTSHILADVLRAPIDFENVPAGSLRELLRRCLDRNVKTRLRDIGEARVALNRFSSVADIFVPVADRPARTSKVWPAVAAVALLVAGLMFWAPWRAEPERRLVRFDVDLGTGVSLPASAVNQNVVLSPDGNRLAYVATASNGQTRLFVRRLDEDHGVELAGTDGAVAAAFSPDSKSLAFVARNRVYRVSADGGATLRLSETEVSSNTLTWGEDGIFLSGYIGAGLRRIPAGGGDEEKVTDLAKGEVIHAQPFVLPGAKAVLFTAGTSANIRIEVVSIPAGDRKVLVSDGTAPHFIEGGYLIYLSQGTLFAIRFDPDKLQTIGDPVPMLADVKMTYSGIVPVGTFSMAKNGTLVYRKATDPTGGPGLPQGREATLQWIDPSGKRSPLLSKVGGYYDVRISPDGNNVALTLIGKSTQSTPSIAIYDSRRDNMRVLSFDETYVNPIFSRPDGGYVVFLNPRPGSDAALVWTRIGGGGQPQALIKEGPRALGSFTPDGKWLAYTARDVTKGRPLFATQIFTVAVTEENGQLKAGTPRLFSPPQSSEWFPEFSPDGEWIAFVKDVSGHDEVLVRAFHPTTSGPGNEVQISNNGGTDPRWSRNGRELLYLEGDRIMSVTYRMTGDTFIADKPRIRLEKLGTVQWDLAPNGSILAAIPVEPQSGAGSSNEHHVVFLQNFADEVKRRVK